MAAKKKATKRAAAAWVRFEHRKSTADFPTYFEVKPLAAGGYQARKMGARKKWLKLAGRRLRTAYDEWSALDAALESVGFGGLNRPRLVKEDWKRSS